MKRVFVCTFIACALVVIAIVTLRVPPQPKFTIGPPEPFIPVGTFGPISYGPLEDGPLETVWVGKLANGHFFASWPNMLKAAEYDEAGAFIKDIPYVPATSPRLQ